MSAALRDAATADPALFKSCDATSIANSTSSQSNGEAPGDECDSRTALGVCATTLSLYEDPAAATQRVRERIMATQQQGNLFRRRVQRPMLVTAVLCFSSGVLVHFLLAGSDYEVLGLCLLFPGSFSSLLSLLPTDKAALEYGSLMGAVGNCLGAYIQWSTFLRLVATRAHAPGQCMHVAYGDVPCSVVHADAFHRAVFAWICVRGAARQVHAFATGMHSHSIMDVLWSVGGQEVIVWGITLAIIIGLACALGVFEGSAVWLCHVVLAVEMLALGAVALEPTFRTRVQAWLASRGGTVAAAAGIASLLGNTDSDEVLRQANALLRCVPSANLAFSDVSSSSPDPTLLAKSQAARIGEIDAFISHSWHDDAQAKWEAFEEWRDDFQRAEGRLPVVWWDKLCIDQNNIDASIRCLPVFLASCNQLVVLCGDTYLERLWCCVEIFVFLEMGGVQEHIQIIPLRRGKREATDGAAAAPEDADECNGDPVLHRTRWLTSKIADFDVRSAGCLLDKDRDRLLCLVEAANGNLGSFNDRLRGVLSAAALIFEQKTSPMFKKRASSAMRQRRSSAVQSLRQMQAALSGRRSGGSIGNAGDEGYAPSSGTVFARSSVSTPLPRAPLAEGQ